MTKNDILIYSIAQDETYKRLRGALNCLGLHQPSTVCQSVSALSDHLKKRSSLRPVIILISIVTKAELDEITAIHTPALFREAKVILILPNHQSDMVHTGFSLQPRFLTFADSDFSEIAKVLAKMLGLNDPCPESRDCLKEILE
jgi:hypothetical protein